jgi:hypothetical protein
MDHEAAAANNHQQLLALLETVLFTGYLVLLDRQGSWGIMAFALVGILAVCFFGVPCEYRRINVDRWRTAICSVVESSGDEDMNRAFDASRYNKSPFLGGFQSEAAGRVRWLFHGLFGHVFERVVLTLVAIGWLVLLWLEDSPIWAGSLAAVLVAGWIGYLIRAPRAKHRAYPGGRP